MRAAGYCQLLAVLTMPDFSIAPALETRVTSLLVDAVITTARNLKSQKQSRSASTRGRSPDATEQGLQPDRPVASLRTLRSRPMLPDWLTGTSCSSISSD